MSRTRDICLQYYSLNKFWILYGLNNISLTFHGIVLNSFLEAIRKFLWSILSFYIFKHLVSLKNYFRTSCLFAKIGCEAAIIVEAYTFTRNTYSSLALRYKVYTWVQRFSLLAYYRRENERQLALTLNNSAKKKSYVKERIIDL